MSSGRARYGESLQVTLRSTAAAYGYTLTISTTMGILTSVHGRPDSGRLFAFVAGGLVAFAALEGVVQLLPRSDACEDGPASAFPFAGVLSFLSVALGLGAATALADGVGGSLAWGLAPPPRRGRTCSVSQPRSRSST